MTNIILKYNGGGNLRNPEVHEANNSVIGAYALRAGQDRAAQFAIALAGRDAAALGNMLNAFSNQMKIPTTPTGNIIEGTGHGTTAIAGFITPEGKVGMASIGDCLAFGIKLSEDLTQVTAHLLAWPQTPQHPDYVGEATFFRGRPDFNNCCNTYNVGDYRKDDNLVEPIQEQSVEVYDYMVMCSDGALETVLPSVNANWGTPATVAGIHSESSQYEIRTYNGLVTQALERQINAFIHEKLTAKNNPVTAQTLAKLFLQMDNGSTDDKTVIVMGKPAENHINVGIVCDGNGKPLWQSPAADEVLARLMRTVQTFNPNAQPVL